MNCMKDKKQDEKQAQYMPIGMCLGIAVGTAIGVATDNLGLWMPIGLSIGMMLGLSYGSMAEAKKKKEEGLTEAELKEQKALYAEYLGEIRKSFRQTLDSIEITD